MDNNLDLIVMLTWNDVTVENAKEVFLESKDALAKHWGFKVAGTTPESMTELLEIMKANGKRTYIEELDIDEETCLNTAELAGKCGADHLLGTLYYPSVHEVCKKYNIGYSPFVALDEDTRMRRPIPEVVVAMEETVANDTMGICLSAFRYLGGEPEELLRAVDSKSERDYYIAGSVNSYERIDFLKTLNKLRAFTIGGAFFEKKFGETFSEQIDAVCQYLQK